MFNVIGEGKLNVKTNNVYAHFALVVGSQRIDKKLKFINERFGFSIAVAERHDDVLDVEEPQFIEADIIFSEASCVRDVVHVCEKLAPMLEQGIPLLFFTENGFTVDVVPHKYETFIVEGVPIEEDDSLLVRDLRFLLKVAKKISVILEDNDKIRIELLENLKILELEKERSEDLLLNILPEETSRELMIHGYAKPQSYRKVSVLFTDFKDFTKMCQNLSPEEIVKELDFFFSAFDVITERHYAEKIKTIGDSYMCAGGIPMRNNSNPIDLVLVAMEMQDFVAAENERRVEKGLPLWQIRIGIHTGRLIAGVIGRKKFAYDIWGDAVNTASRMESSGEVGKINISEGTYKHVEEFFECEYRGEVYAKNKGNVDMYFVNGLKDRYSRDVDGRLPNDEFVSELSQL